MVNKRTYEYISENVIVIYDSMFPLYIIKGDKNVLVDSGVTTKGEEFRVKIDEVLRETGESDSAKIDTLLLTHSHWDHAGAAYYLQQIYGFDVYASHRAVELLQKEKVIAFIDRLNQDYKKMRNDTSDRVFKKLDKLIGIGEGDRIPIGSNSYLEVIETPGHTKCSVSYLLQPDGVLFPGDATGVLEQNGGHKPLFLSSYTNFEHSLEKLLQLSDVKVMALPHNMLIRGEDRIKNHIRGALARTRELRDTMLQLLKEKSDITEMAELVYRQEFPKPTLLGPREALMINLEAMIKSVATECAGK